MRTYLIFCLAGFLLLGGCAVLTDSQVMNINTFAATTRAYCNYPSAVVRQYSELHQTLEIMDAAGQPDLPSTLAQLGQARKSYLDIFQLSAQVDASLQLIQQYGTLLVKLSSDQFVADLRDPTQNLGANLDKAVALFDQKTVSNLAATAGSDFAKVFLLLGQKLTKRKQTQALKEFILKTDTLISAATLSLEAEMDQTMKPLLQMDSGRFAHDAGRVLVSGMESAELVHMDSMDFPSKSRASVPSNLKLQLQKRGLNIERYLAAHLYYDGISGYLTAEALRLQVIHAAESLRQAHKALVRNIQEKKSLKELINEVKQFVSDVQPLGPIAGRYFQLPSTLPK